MAAGTNDTSLSYTIEATQGVLPGGTPDWYELEPNDIGTFGASITTVARNPISNDRMAKKGAITDLDSSVEFDSDLTVSSLDNFIEGFLFADYKAQVTTGITACTTATDIFTTPALSAAFVADDLIYIREMVNSENNGLFLVDSSPVPSVTETPVTDNIVDETAPSNAKLDYAGFQAGIGDLEVDSNGDLISNGAFDFTADVGGSGLIPGMFIYIGDGTAANSFFTAGSVSARIRVVAAAKLTLDVVKQQVPDDGNTWGIDDGTDDSSGGTGLTIRVFVGSWIRNVPLDHADFLNRTYQFEAEYTNLDIDGDTVEDETGFEYAIGNHANQLTLNLPLTDKATVGWSFIGLDQDTASDTQKTGTWVANDDTDAFNTTSDFIQSSFEKSDGTDIGTFFKDMTITINNNISPEKILGTLGAHNTNLGDFTVSMTTQVLFTSLEAMNAVRNNETIGLSWAVENDDGAFHFDLPSMTLGGATKSFARNETIKIDINGETFKDSFFGYVISITRYPYLPITG